MVQFLHNHAFVEDWLDLVLSEELVLLHDLHGVKATCIFFPNQNDSAEGTSTNYLDLLKVMSSHFLIKLGVLSEVELGKVGSEEFSVLNDSNWSVVEGEPVVKSLPLVSGLEGNNKLLLKLNLLVNNTHALFPGVSADVMNNLKVLVCVLALKLAVLSLFRKRPVFLEFLFFPLDCLFLQDFVVSSCNFRLEPPACQIGIWNHDGEFNVRFDEYLNLLRLILFEICCVDVAREEVKLHVLNLLWVDLSWLLTAYQFLRSHNNHFLEHRLRHRPLGIGLLTLPNIGIELEAFLVGAEEVPDGDVVLTADLQLLVVVAVHAAHLLVTLDQHLKMVLHVLRLKLLTGTAEVLVDSDIMLTHIG